MLKLNSHFGYQNNFDYMFAVCVWACLGKPISYIWFFEKQGHTQTPVLNKEKPAAFDLEQFLRNEAISLNCRSHRNIWNVLSSFLSIKRIAYFLSSIRFLFSPKKKRLLWQTFGVEIDFQAYRFRCNWYSFCFCALTLTNIQWIR